MEFDFRTLAPQDRYKLLSAPWCRGRSRWSLRVDQGRLQLIGRLAGTGYVHLSDRFEIPRISVDEWTARKANGGAQC